MDTVHQALITHMSKCASALSVYMYSYAALVYTYLITSFGSFDALDNIVW